MKTEVICCVCKKHLHWIDTPYGGVSDGYCDKHYWEAMCEVDEALRRDDAFRRDEALRQQKEE